MYCGGPSSSSNRSAMERVGIGSGAEDAGTVNSVRQERTARGAGHRGRKVVLGAARRAGDLDELWIGGRHADQTCS